MHLLQDENGNVIPHGHDGEHCHRHEEGDCHRHEESDCHHHEEGHCHRHEEGHCHQHGHGPMETKAQMAALLDYMLKHNQSHAAELDKMASRLTEENLPEASEQVRKAVDEFTKGNLYLSLALSSVKEA